LSSTGADTIRPFGVLDHAPPTNEAADRRGNAVVGAGIVDMDRRGMPTPIGLGGTAGGMRDKSQRRTRTVGQNKGIRAGKNRDKCGSCDRPGIVEGSIAVCAPNDVL